MDISISEKIAELQARLLEAPMNNDGYLASLIAIRHQSSITMQIAILRGELRGTAALSTVMDRTHWLIDSAEKKSARDNPVDSGYRFTFQPWDDGKQKSTVEAITVDTADA